jgi:RNA polymerase sigma factor (sigma-70 family)
MTDLDLIKNIRDNKDNESLKSLIDRHSGIFCEIVKRYQHFVTQKGHDPKDLFEEKDMVVYQSALSFNEDKNIKFSTWLGNQARYHCLNFLNKNAKFFPTENNYLQNIIESSQDNKENLNQENCEYFLNILKSLKDKRAYKIFKMRFFSSNKKNRSWNAIGKRLNMSTQTAINIYNKHMQFLKIKSNKNFNDQI